MAQIQLHQGNYVSAQQSLEVGLSYNFEVRDHPLFHLVGGSLCPEAPCRLTSLILSSMDD